MMIAWTIFKLGFSKLFEFVAEYWRVILPLLILWYCYTQYNAAIERAETAEASEKQVKQDFTNFQNEIFQQTVKQMEINRLAKEKAKTDLAESEAKYNVLAKLNLDRERETKNLKDLYENRISNIKSNYAQRLSIESSKNERDSAGMSDTGADTRGLTEAGRECDGAYTTLEKACQITTSDYNRLRGWADVACKQVGCK